MKINKHLINLLETDPDNLYRKQLDGLKEHAVNVLKNIINLIEKEEFTKIEDLTEYSPAGDDMGCNNNFINFSPGGKEDDSWDIMEITEKMQSIKGKLN
jgi:hypothetical protein